MSSCRKSDDVTSGMHMKTMDPRRGLCQVSSRLIEITLSERTHTLLVLFVDIAKFVRPSLQIELCFLDPVDIQRASFSGNVTAQVKVTNVNNVTNTT